MATKTTTQNLIKWTDLELYTVDDEQVRDPETIRRALSEFRDTGSIRDYYLGRIGAAHEVDDDVSTWGPENAAEVDWTGFADEPTTYRIVTVSGRGLPTGVDSSGYDTELAAEAMAEDCHDGEYRIEAER